MLSVCSLGSATPAQVDYAVSMVDRFARGPNKRAGEKGHNRPGADTRAFQGERRKLYLDELAKCGLRIVAQEKANVCSATVTKHRNEDPEFAQAEADAMEKHNAMVEGEVRRRGIEGVQEAIYWEGAVVGWKTVYSDKLLELYAKRRIREYNPRVEIDQNTNHGGSIAVGLADLSKLSADGRKLLRELLTKEGVASDAPAGPTES